MPDHLPDILRLPGRVDLLQTYLHRFDRPHTRRSYENDLSAFFGTRDISLENARRISFLDINAHIADLEGAGLKPSTIKRRIAALRGFFEWLLALELVDRNPTERTLLRRVRSSTSRERKVVVLSSDQARRMIAATDNFGHSALRDRALIQTLLYCVLRRSEAAAMNVDHVRPLGWYWIVDLPDSKGGTDQYVKIPEHVVDSIQVMREHYGIDNGALWRSFSNNSHMKRLSDRSIYAIVERAAAAAGLHDDVGAHTLRHTGCTLAIERGASVHQVQSHARHKKIETTMIYVHQRDRLRDSAADYIDLSDPDATSGDETPLT